MPEREAINYSLPTDLVQTIVSILNELPAGRVRGVLNALEQTCTAQDEARQAAKLDALLEQRAKA